MGTRGRGSGVEGAPEEPSLFPNPTIPWFCSSGEGVRGRGILPGNRVAQQRHRHAPGAAPCAGQLQPADLDRVLALGVAAYLLNQLLICYPPPLAIEVPAHNITLGDNPIPCLLQRCVSLLVAL